jgi:hypothetical protein
MRKNFKLTLVALSLLALTACSAEHEPTMGKYPILFGCTDTTRADVGAATEEDLKRNGFRVYAFVDGVNDISFTKDVYWVENNEVWAYDYLEYWVPGCKYSFRAFYPNPEDNYTLNVDTTSADLSYTIDNFDITSQQDLMQASATAEVAQGDAAPEGGSIVKFTFNHLLANIVVKIKSEINGVIVKSVSFENIANKGNLNNSVWSSNEETSLTKTKEISLVKDADFVDVTDGGFLVIPQQIDGKSQYINIETTHKIYNDIIIPKIKWENGMKYTYTLTIKQDNIIFDKPSVEEWDEENATGSVIIK